MRRLVIGGLWFIEFPERVEFIGGVHEGAFSVAAGEITALRASSSGGCHVSAKSGFRSTTTASYAEVLAFLKATGEDGKAAA